MRVPRQPDHRRLAAPRVGVGRGSGRLRWWLRWLALAVACVVLIAAGAGWALLRDLENNLVTDVTTAEELARYEAQRPDPAPGDARNILLIGTDGRQGQGQGRGRSGRGGERSDAVILLHLAGDRRSATAVSIPRDLLVEIPRCARLESGDGGGGGQAAARRAQFNWAYRIGGAACTIRTLERLTRIRVDHHLIVDYGGFERIVDAVGGVELCLEQPVRDRSARLELPAGRQTVSGEDALAYVRARKDLGGGSDTERIARQQQFLDALVRQVSDGGMLQNPAKLFPVLDAATSSVTTDTRLDSLVKLYDVLREVRTIPADNFRFLTVPRRSDAADSNHDVLRQPAANALFKRLRRDQPPGAGAVATHRTATGGSNGPAVLPTIVCK